MKEAIERTKHALESAAQELTQPESLIDFSMSQSYQSPPDKFSYKKHIVGVGFLDATLEWYFVFSDDYRSHIETKSKLTDFKETKVPQTAVIAKVQV